MIEAFKAFVNSVSSPVTIFTSAIVVFGFVLAFPRAATNKLVSGAGLLLILAFFAVGLGDPNFRKIVAAPDNIPIVAMIFIFGYFTWYALRKATENDRRLARGEPTIEATETNDKVLVFPYLIFIEFVVALFYAIGLVVWSLLLKAPLEEPANPAVSPNPSKAPWYFLGLQEMLVYFDPWLAGVVFPTAIILGLMALPYLDINKKGQGYYSFKERKMAVSIFMAGWLLLWVFLITVGTFLRGPNWNFFGPFEVWDPHKLEALTNINVSEYVYMIWFKRRLPQNIFLRELPGFTLTLFYFGALPLLLAKTLFKNLYKTLGPFRYSVFVMLLLMAAMLPMKMFLRWAFNIKYIIAIPEYFFNI